MLNTLCFIQKHENVYVSIQKHVVECLTIKCLRQPFSEQNNILEL